MKKKLLVLTSTLCMGLFAHADSTDINAIYVWVSGTSTCYKLESMPQVTYDNGSAVLTLSDKTTPELTLPLENDQQLEVTFGVYQETATKVNIQNLPDTKITKKGKYISGGQLVIIKDGKKFNSKGIEIK